MTYVTRLTPAQIQTARTQSQSIANSATTVIGGGKFVFFAAFDGTNNDRRNPTLARDGQMTNVGVIEQLVFRGNSNNPNVQTGYYSGPGTPAAQQLVTGSTTGHTLGQGLPTPQMQATADRAYKDFEREAREWLAADPSRSPSDITTSIIGFSRGAPNGVVFSQLLAERGLTDASGNVLIPPGSAPVSAMLLIEPVSTGYLGSRAIPDGVTNITVIRALDERRLGFEGDDYSNDARVNTQEFIGNHGDSGGFYDRGLGAIALAMQLAFLNNSGIATAAIPAERSFDPALPLVMHNEGRTPNGIMSWTESPEDQPRGSNRIAAPVLHQGIQNTADQANSDGTTTRTIRYNNGQTVQQLIDGDGQPALTAGPGESLLRDPTTGIYSITNNATLASRSYDPSRQEYSLYSPQNGAIVVDKDGEVTRLLPPSQLTAPSVSIEGQTWSVAANGMLYRTDASGRMVVRDSITNNGTISDRSADGALTPKAFFITEGQPPVDASGNALQDEVTVTYDAINGNPTQTASRSYTPGNELAGTITDTPDGAGGMNRVVNTTVNGNDVQITQHASATALGTDNDHDGNNTDPGDYTSTGITINGQPGVNSPITVALIDELYPSANDIIRARGTGNLNHIVTAANPADTDGVVRSPVAITGLEEWFNSPEALGLAGFLGDGTSLISALRSGRRVAVSTATKQPVGRSDIKGTTYLIASPAIFYWSGWLKYYKNTAVNNEFWREAA